MQRLRSLWMEVASAILVPAAGHVFSVAGTVQRNWSEAIQRLLPTGWS